MASIIVPSTRLTLLQAVNVLIGSLGEAPVDTIDPPPHEDAEAALARINEVDLLMQSRGWSWNTEVDYPLTLDGDLKFPLPDQCIQASRGSSEFAYTNVIQLGDFMYDRDRRSFEYPAGTTLKADLLLRRDWDQLPQQARSFVTYRACQLFHSQKDGSQIVLQVNASDISVAWAALESLEDTYDPQNTTYSPYTAIILNGVGGLRRNRQGIR